MNHFNTLAPTLMASGVRSLFISYDGLTDPLGRSQILPYLVGLSERGHRIHVLSFEKPDRFSGGECEVRGACDRAGICWHPLTYHRRPPVASTIFDIARMALAAFRLHRRTSFHLTHCRSYIPALVGLALKRSSGVPLVFDMRGFWPEERTESGEWNVGKPLYRAVYTFFKRAETRMLMEADQVVSLTRAAARVLARNGRREGVTIIPCAVDFRHFPLTSPQRRISARELLGLPADGVVLAYLGSLGGNHLLDEMLEFYRELRRRRSGSHFLFITPTPRPFVEAAAVSRGIPLSEVRVVAASRDEVPMYIAAADLGISFKRAQYSSLACSPTKLGEMLAMGIPMVANSGVGDVDEILSETGGGVIIDGFSLADYERAIDRLMPAAEPERLRMAALGVFDLNHAVAAYDAIYRLIGTAEVPEADKAAIPPETLRETI